LDEVAALLAGTPGVCRCAVVAEPSPGETAIGRIR
jgi:hypothetical protein